MREPFVVSFRTGALLTLLGGLLVWLGTAESFTRPDAKESVDSPGFSKILVLPGFLVSVLILFRVRLSNSIANPSFPLIVEKTVKALNNLWGE